MPKEGLEPSSREASDFESLVYTIPPLWLVEYVDYIIKISCYTNTIMATIENAIYWLEVEKIIPNPYQPRKEFDPIQLQEMADSIRQYGILQPLVVSRFEEMKEDGSIEVVYQLIAGERRLRGSKLAGLSQVPCIIRVGDDNREKLEIAIIENVVRENLNPVERGMAYQRLAEEFKLTWVDIAKKVSKSREYVSNTVRILMLPQDMLDALSKGKITEGHTRPLLMLIDRPEEQATLFKEMLIRKMTVREAEGIARRVAYDKVRKKSTYITPEVVEMEEGLAQSLGTRVTIEPREKGGKISIDYFTYDELMSLSRLIKNASSSKTHVGMFDAMKNDNTTIGGYTEELPVADVINTLPTDQLVDNLPAEYFENNSALADVAVDDRSKEEVVADNNTEDTDLYNIKNFSL